MEIQTLAIIIVVFLALLINVVASILFFKVKIGYTKTQKIFQFLIIWLIPIIGAIVIISLRKSLNEPALTPEENRKKREWINSNKDSLDNSS